MKYRYYLIFIYDAIIVGGSTVYHRDVLPSFKGCSVRALKYRCFENENRAFSLSRTFTRENSKYTQICLQVACFGWMCARTRFKYVVPFSRLSIGTIVIIKTYNYAYTRRKVFRRTNYVNAHFMAVQLCSQSYCQCCCITTEELLKVHRQSLIKVFIALRHFSINHLFHSIPPKIIYKMYLNKQITLILSSVNKYALLMNQFPFSILKKLVTFYFIKSKIP